MSFLNQLFKPKSAAPKYQSNVRSYLDDYDGKPVYTLVDLGLAEIAPVAEFTRYLAVILPVELNKEGDGPDVSGAELKALHKVEDKCIREAESKGFLYAGRAIVTAAEHMDINFYCREKDKKAIIESLLQICKTNGREPTRIQSMNDPEWGFYLERLYPDIRHIQPINHEEILEDLKRHGDSGAKPRPVSFWMYFPTKADAERCQREATGEGYHADTAIEDMSKNKDFHGKKPFALTVKKDMPLSMDSMNAEAWKLIDMAAKFNGDYDGIETDVLKGG